MIFIWRAHVYIRFRGVPPPPPPSSDFFDLFGREPNFSPPGRIVRERPSVEMLGARRCNVVGDRPLVVLLGDIQDWGIAICCCTKFVQKIICDFFFLLGLSTCKMN